MSFTVGEQVLLKGAPSPALQVMEIREGDRTLMVGWFDKQDQYRSQWFTFDQVVAPKVYKLKGEDL